MTNPASSAIVNAIGQIRQVVTPYTAATDERRYLVIAPAMGGNPGAPVQVQTR